jgi:chromosome segregation ATPase
MDYTDATNQIAKIEQQTQDLAQQLQTFAQKLDSQAPDPATGKEWVLDLKQIAINVQTQNQTLMMMINQMAEHIHDLEQQLDTHPNPTMQARGWGNQMAPRGGGFWGNVTSGMGMGAGFGVANALIGGIFNAL